jgi:phosphoadenosine phosphosulfate reductase
MPLEAPLSPVADRVVDLNARYANNSAISVLERALTDPQVGQIAMVSSFGAESVALLHMMSVIDRTTPVLFIDTEMLFPETLDYQLDLTRRLQLSDVRVLRPDRDEAFTTDPQNDLHRHDPDACCALRKLAPMSRAVAPFDAWISGRKRYQGGRRTTLAFFEDEDGRRIKVNPLAFWTRDDVQDYIVNNRLPRHPLVERGFPSIGCAPCTTSVAPGEDPRAGRWRGQEKVECGLHFADGKSVRGATPRLTN